MATRRKAVGPDIRLVFDKLSDDALLDDVQLGLLAGRSPMTIKRWRRERKTPPVIRLNGLPRFRAGDVRPWLRGASPARPRAHPKTVSNDNATPAV